MVEDHFQVVWLLVRQLQSASFLQVPSAGRSRRRRGSAAAAATIAAIRYHLFGIIWLVCGMVKIQEGKLN